MQKKRFLLFYTVWKIQNQLQVVEFKNSVDIFYRVTNRGVIHTVAAAVKHVKSMATQGNDRNPVRRRASSCLSAIFAGTVLLQRRRCVECRKESSGDARGSTEIPCVPDCRLDFLRHWQGQCDSSAVAVKHAEVWRRRLLTEPLCVAERRPAIL